MKYRKNILWIPLDIILKKSSLRKPVQNKPKVSERNSRKSEKKSFFLVNWKTSFFFDLYNHQKGFYSNSTVYWKHRHTIKMLRFLLFFISLFW